MDHPVDKRGVLDAEIFSYRITADNKVFISWHGKQAAILRGAKAEAFIADMDGTGGKAAQLIMARATGNFKRGNEKMNKGKKEF